ncbi:MAG: tail fiber domain-containing protein, partial [Candidatus Korobacteraceae bacterium]
NDYSFSLLSGTLADGQLSGSYSSALTFSNGSDLFNGSFTGNGAGLTNVPVSAGSPNYIQNGTSQQASSNFNISGSGTVGGTLTATASVNTNGTYQIGGATILNYQTSGNNTFLGGSAGASSTSGTNNTFLGGSAGKNVTTGYLNLAAGSSAGGSLTTGQANVLLGSLAGYELTTGQSNTLVGYGAGNNAGGLSNVISIGYFSGTQLNTGSNDIYLGNAGTASESSTMRLGTQGQQTATYIAGISGATVSGGIDVLINSNGLLGTTTSSRRFKDNILDMGEASSKLFQLRPVTFFYKPQYDDGSHILQYGLIAEEVAKVYPDLVVYGEDGQPQTIRYHLLTPMLLNELQKQHKIVAEQQDLIKAQQERMSTQEARITGQDRQIEDLQQRLSRVESLLVQISETSQRK